ncbi:cell division protein FtsL [Neisseria meningitidis ATCC 13091]|uniref:Cell division protein FtsL n=2 Tax=Neisseria meningitidis TaxID=487 RepID=E0N6Q3_NEIM3|nr:cell division protein FtsL [Neisseria meningitidis ATCC 13091]
MAMNKLNFLLLLAVCVSAFSVVIQQNQYRLNFTALDKAKKQEIALEQDYAQMRLQQARLANHEAIRAAAEKQNLHPPVSGNTFMVEHQR